MELEASNMASPWNAAAWPALQVGPVVNVSVMIVLGSVGVMLGDTLKADGRRLACPMP